MLCVFSGRFKMSACFQILKPRIVMSLKNRKRPLIFYLRLKGRCIGLFLSCICCSFMFTLLICCIELRREHLLTVFFCRRSFCYPGHYEPPADDALRATETTYVRCQYYGKSNGLLGDRPLVSYLHRIHCNFRKIGQPPGWDSTPVSCNPCKRENHYTKRTFNRKLNNFCKKICEFTIT